MASAHKNENELAAYSHRMYEYKYTSIHSHPVHTHTHTIQHTKYYVHCARDTRLNRCVSLLVVRQDIMLVGAYADSRGFRLKNTRESAMRPRIIWGFNDHIGEIS